MVTKICCLLLLLLLLLPSLVTAQTSPVSKRLDSLQIAVLQQLNIVPTGTRGITLAMVATLINRAYSQVCADFPAIEKTATVTVASTAEGGTLPTDFQRLHKAFRTRGDSLRIPLKVISIDSLEIVTQTFKDNIQKAGSLSPRFCYTFGQLLRFNPKYKTSTEVDTLFILYYAMGSKLDSIADTLECAPKYIEKVIWYATASVAKIENRFQDAAIFMRLYDPRQPLLREQELQQ